MSETAIHDALDRLVPDCAGERGDWEDVLAHRRRPRRRAVFALVLAAALVVGLFATPAFGLLRNLLVRHDVSFSRAPTAPATVKRDFAGLALGAPSAFSGVNAGAARRVGTFPINGRMRALWVAPTRAGGYCYTFDQAFGSCRWTVTERRPRLGVTWLAARSHSPGASGSPRPASLGGDLTGPAAAKLEVEYQDGQRSSIPFVYVSRPIAAGFFTFDVPPAHQAPGHAARAVVLLDRGGHELTRQTFDLTPPPALRRLPPTQRARSIRLLPASLSHAPSTPLQRGAAGGVSVVAGHNGIVEFHAGALDSQRRRLLRGAVSYACFRIVREYGLLTDREISAEGAFTRAAAIRVNGVGTPFDGCEIQGEYGHLWPDVLGSHSAVEIPLTATGRAWFADRAAARDLGLFMRSRRLHAIRGLTAAPLVRAIEAYGGRRVVRLAGPRSPVGPGHIGFATSPTGVTLVETSPTGRRFTMRVEHGRVVQKNLEPYALGY